MALTSAASAALPDGVTIGADKRTVHMNVLPHLRAQLRPPPAKRNVVFDNLASLDPLGVFMVGTGEAIGGPKSDVGKNWFAAAFTPVANVTVTEVKAAVGYIDGAHAAIQLAIYADAAGVPGTLLWSQRARLPVEGDCCAVAKAHDKAGLVLTAGTQYWLGVTTLPDGSTTFAAWNFNVADQVDPGTTAVDIGKGWMPVSSLPNVAFAVYGD